MIQVIQNFEKESKSWNSTVFNTVGTYTTDNVLFWDINENLLIPVIELSSVFKYYYFWHLFIWGQFVKSTNKHSVESIFYY